MVQDRIPPSFGYWSNGPILNFSSSPFLLCPSFGTVFLFFFFFSSFDGYPAVFADWMGRWISIVSFPLIFFFKGLDCFSGLLWFRFNSILVLVRVSHFDGSFFCLFLKFKRHVVDFCESIQKFENCFHEKNLYILCDMLWFIRNYLNKLLSHQNMYIYIYFHINVSI